MKKKKKRDRYERAKREYEYALKEIELLDCLKEILN